MGTIDTNLMRDRSHDRLGIAGQDAGPPTQVTQRFDRGAGVVADSVSQSRDGDAVSIGGDDDRGCAVGFDVRDRRSQMGWDCYIVVEHVGGRADAEFFAVYGRADSAV